jgi:hypothetical protein
MKEFEPQIKSGIRLVINTVAGRVKSRWPVVASPLAGLANGLLNAYSARANRK